MSKFMFYCLVLGYSLEVYVILNMLALLCFLLSSAAQLLCFIVLLFFMCTSTSQICSTENKEAIQLTEL